MRDTPDTREEAAAKLPALHVMMVMGWHYLRPSEALTLRGSERGVMSVIRVFGTNGSLN